ncbi:MAG TPA: hypothetical protein VJI97_04200 [Candidatus Nanoarchaeia archaeon]|nr:hypothetical protein [Candidatus Nanoarchaeia archaeon]
MAELVDLRDKISKYYKFTPAELRGVIISILVLAFIISFKNWGTMEFNPAEGIFNLFNAVLIVALSFLVHDAGQRVWGLAIGYRVEYKFSALWLMIAVILAFISNGSLWLIIPGGFMVHHLAGHRLGFFRYGINYFGQAMVALAGPLSSLILLIFLKMIYAVAPNALVEKAIMFNVIYIITSMLPIPPLDGSKIIFGSRMTYAFLLPAIIVATILMIINIPIFLALVLSMIMGTLLWLWYYISFERKIWSGPK